MEEQGKKERLPKTGRDQRETKVNGMTGDGGRGVEQLHKRQLGVNIICSFIQLIFIECLWCARPSAKYSR